LPGLLVRCPPRDGLAVQGSGRGPELRLRLAEVSSEEAPDIAREFGIAGIPRLVLCQGGREVVRQACALPARQGGAWIEAHL
jgi:thioredoxin 2